VATESALTDWPPPQVARLPGARLHLQHGPIDLVIKADGDQVACRKAYSAAGDRFRTILGELVGELAHLRRPLAGSVPPVAEGMVARRMIAACWPHRSVFITPMAAVAGSVADEIRDAMLAAAPGLRTLYVNNGGDIAVHASGSNTLRIGLVADLARAAPEGFTSITGGSGIGGVATSGWRGRSFSLGIADAVTVLARSAAEADAAATIIANAVNVEDSEIRRAPAESLDPDSDLADLAVTVAVGRLSAEKAKAAISRGLSTAAALRQQGLMIEAFIALQGEAAVCTAHAAGLFRQADGWTGKHHAS
jgi:uncharacterized protein